MALGRWWNPFTRKGRPTPEASGFADGAASLVAGRAVAPAVADRAPRRRRGGRGGTVPTRSGARSVDEPPTHEQRLRFFRWIVGVPASRRRRPACPTSSSST